MDASIGIAYFGEINGFQTLVTDKGKIYQRNVDGEIGEWELKNKPK